MDEQQVELACQDAIDGGTDALTWNNSDGHIPGANDPRLNVSCEERPVNRSSEWFTCTYLNRENQLKTQHFVVIFHELVTTEETTTGDVSLVTDAFSASTVTADENILSHEGQLTVIIFMVTSILAFIITAICLVTVLVKGQTYSQTKSIS